MTGKSVKALEADKSDHLRKALELCVEALKEPKWTSTHKDNMEFACRLLIYTQMDKINKAIAAGEEALK